MPHPMTLDCRLYLITPPALPDLAGFGRQLAQALEGGDVAALQIRLKDVPDDVIRAAVDALAIEANSAFMLRDDVLTNLDKSL